MEIWKDNHVSSILEYPFDHERYIEERLREIPDLDERAFAKKTLLEGLGKVIRSMEGKYRQLERRIYEELEIAANQYETVMTVIQREHYDPTNETLYPVCEADLEEQLLAETLSSEGEQWVGTLFLEADSRTRRAFEEAGPFKGCLAQGEEAGPVFFQVRPASRYRKAMEELYQLFQDNHIPWETVNTGYLDLFYDVYAVTLPGDGEKGKGRGIFTEREQWQIAFGDFEKWLRWHRIPLWNMRWETFDSRDFMIPCTDQIYFEHEFSLGDKEQQDGYLIRANEDILEIRREPMKIIVKSARETFEGWQVFHMIQKETEGSLDYEAPLLTNRRQDSFIRRYAEKRGRQLMTKADLFRRVMELDIRDYIEAAGYEICSNPEAYPREESMNWFVRDELFPMESRKILLLKFRARQPGHYLNDSMVRFVISSLQLEVSEYRCVGVME